MKAIKSAFLDTNILVYAADTNSPYFRESYELRERGLCGDLSLCISLQVMSEFFAVVTDPKRVAKPLPIRVAISELEKYSNSISIKKIHPSALSFEILIDLLSRYQASKQDVFDAQLVAVMLANRITRLYTFNCRDFVRYKEIEVLTPIQFSNL